MARWAQPLRSRDQILLFAPTLEDSIPDDHPVRLFDEVLRQLDFKEWERRYFLLDGQPPIHPRVMAGVILYGLSLGIRASRKLEYACGNNIDFIWLAQGRVIDHSTLAGFRTRFETELKGMFRQIGRLAIGMGMANLNQVALDGTVKRASNSRSAVARRTTLEQKLSALDQRVEELMQEAAAADRKDDELFGESAAVALPKELKDIKARQKQLAAALKKVREIEAKQQARGRASEKGPAVPTTDPDSNLMKNKTGGFAPNHLVVLTTEGNNGLIMDYQVPANDDEPSTVMQAMNNLKEAYGGKGSGEGKESQERSNDCSASSGPTAPTVVKELLADTNFNTGSNLNELKQAGIAPFMPAKPSGLLKTEAGHTSENIAAATPSTGPRAAETTTVQADVPAVAGLPLNAKTKAFDRSAFTYDKQVDVYHCPGGRTLPLYKNKTERQEGRTLNYAVYRSTSCRGCPLASQCLSGRNRDDNSRRTIRRDEHEPLREEMAARMQTPQGREKYKRRSFLAETPFAAINTTMNVRQLLLRGLDKVTTEIGWICTAYNLKKITRLLTDQRQEGVLASG